MDCGREYTLLLSHGIEDKLCVVNNVHMILSLVKQQWTSLTVVIRQLLSCAGRRLPVCPYCYRVFRNASSGLRRHMWIHEGIKPFECHVCQYTCRTRSNLAAHMLRHSTDKPFLCNSCGKAYKSRTALRWHERSHVSGRIFKCDKYVLILVLFLF